MIKERYVNFEAARLLREKGFDERCIMFYHNNELTPTVNLESVKENASCVFNSWLYEGDYAAPTHQMAMAWLREKGIFIDVRIADSKWFCMIVRRFEGVDNGCTGERRAMGYYDTYEDAVEAAILECLTKIL